ncbi:MAG TPA: BamA/TamA family outer membrane protein, partial [Capsulimonadaceae bacterium]|nr:BamA/TamA family outer membrane protein [Capsulimonadaceae bacterium]
WVVLREFKSKVGDVYNEGKLRQDLTRVYNMGLFDTVGPAERSTPQIGKIAVTVPVTERRTGQVSVGVGYSSTEKLVGEATLSENNFRGRGETVSVQWTVGGVQSQSSVEVAFGDPWIDKYHDGFSIDLYNKAIYRFTNSFFSGPQISGSSQYLERHRGGLLTLSRPVNDFTTAFVSTRIESVETNDVSVPLSDTFIRQNVDLAGVGVRLVNNTRDNDINPATGGYFGVSAEEVDAKTSTINNAPTPLAPGRESFGKYGIDFRRYISLQGPRRKSITELKKVVAFRLLAGTTARDIPFSEQYFLGGADSLRGYDEDRFWGNNLVLLNAEVRIPMGSSLQLVLFNDAGDAWGSIYQGAGLKQSTAFQLQDAVGAGLRVTTPLGTIRVDYGVGREGGRADFSIGQSF